MLLLMAANSSKVLKKSIRVSVWIQIRTNVGPYLEPNCLQRLSADDESQRV